ncbi:hypothetical protein DU258_08140 [Salmonella enterica subsp. enterica]|nr:hypothetical protein [Salmonella enterica subsp. enterica serovar Kambole]EBV2191756.1 hypothetical protein [Salmonella enterica subsp. enterica serovar Afula]ECH9428006.1 hypothetical protein [Salmonella enterica subsp. enterica]EBS2653862.1 hypothetical protein [Salmonella enterica subsp. enterica serovar Kambole]EBY4015437.1 hypothetical protein [Salmonella enterica subsp. enterica serovar Kambole]
MLVAITLISAFIEERDKKKSRSVTGAARVIQPVFNTVRRPDKQRAIRRYPIPQKITASSCGVIIRRNITNG